MAKNTRGKISYDPCLHVRARRRGAPPAAAGPVLRAVSALLHASYAPGHIVHHDKPPFHISRRGWGEFPARVTLHFALPERNPPATVDHPVTLDKNYTGVQTLGAETIVDVWLYSNEEMLKYEYTDDIETPLAIENIKTEVKEETEATDNTQPTDPIDTNKQLDSWLDFFKNDNTELDVDEMIIKAVKKECNIDNLIGSTEDKTLETICGSLNTDNLQIANNTDLETKIKQELIEDTVVHNEPVVTETNLTNHVKMEVDEEVPSAILNQPTTPKKRIMKYMDPNTGKIYYLEMDRNLDLSKVQEIVINSKGNTKTAKISPIRSNGLKNVRRTPKKSMSLLKPEINNQLKTEKKEKVVTKLKRDVFKHLQNDHCYLGHKYAKTMFGNDTVLPDDNNSLETVKDVGVASQVTEEAENKLCLYEKLCDAVKRFSCVRVAVNYLLRKIPLICETKEVDFYKNLPFVAESEDWYWKLDFSKRRNIEWSRAKTIQKILLQHSNLKDSVWRTKQILLFSRLHGYYPIRQERHSISEYNVEEWTSWNDVENTRKLEADIKETYPNFANSLTLFNPSDFISNDENTELVDLTEADEVVDIVNDVPVTVKKEVLPETNNLEVLPVQNEDERLMFMFIERKCADIGIELRNEDVGNGYSYSAVHAVILSAVKSFAEELLRSALAGRLTGDRTSADPPLPVWTRWVVQIITSYL
ncbi:unnamed protein product [Plutella xylostella]|uniref:(diamondback moth) hypothetical protein n=1 Tax=Plutella xylostella TaxID=51655 RepID=A0A8S4G2H0_PLUXY|nr:unnamed protein product [Plutella xylostella]